MNCCCVWQDVTTTKHEHPQCPHAHNDQLLPKSQQTTKAQVCERLKQYHELSTILQSVLDITATIVQIMEFVCIHQCKCQKAMDIIIYAFLHFDEFVDRPCGHSRKQIRKEEFQCDLRRDCCFTKQETKITYAITKYAFQAFYFKQIVTRFDDSFIDECVWLLAAKKTVKAFKQLDGVCPTDICAFSTNVHCAYKHYLERRRAKNEKLRSKYECCCNQNRSGGNNDWLHPVCDTANQPCSGKKAGQEFTKKDCTCVCPDATVGNVCDDGTKGSGGSAGGGGSIGGNNKNDPQNNSAKGDAGAYSGSDCMKLKTCEEQLKCVQDKLLNMEKEKADWDAEKLRLQEEADKLKSEANAYNDLIGKLGPDFDADKELAIKKSPEEFSLYLKFFQNGKNCQIDLAGLDLSDDYITHITDLKITNDTSENPVNFHCIRTEF